MSDTKKLQINFKDGKADLINIYADTEEELIGLLASLQNNADVIRETEAALRGGAAGHQQAVQNVASAFPGAQVGGDVSAPAPAGGGPACAHGPMVFKQGTSKQGKPYSAHFCSVKGSSCQPVWG